MAEASRNHISGVLLLYRRPISRWFRDASTIDEHIAAFARHSRYAVHSHDTELGYPSGLDASRFDAVVLHYSLFGGGAEGYPFSPRFERTLDDEIYKVAFFHDEHTHCGQRFEFLNRHRIDCVFTCLEEAEFGAVYGSYTEVPVLVSHLPGYVSESLEQLPPAPLEPERPLDVGFRARPLAPYMGPDDKAEMGEGFAGRAAGTGLTTDIEVSHDSLLPGESWFEFMGSSRAMLGVESGTRTFDLEDEVLRDFERVATERGGPSEVTLDDLDPAVLARWTDRVRYRTIGPRHFEAAALRVCQVLFEGSYSGLMEPMRHYIPVKRDFSNFDEVVERIRDEGLRRELAENAHRDLVASREHTYAALIAKLDAVLADAGLDPGGGAAGTPGQSSPRGRSTAARSRSPPIAFARGSATTRSRAGCCGASRARCSAQGGDCSAARR